MDIKIEVIDRKSPYLTKVKKLSDENNSTLGFLPSGAFDDFAIRKQIIIALDSKNNCVGYLLYRPSTNRIIIIHLCIEKKCRKQRIATTLVDYLKNNTKVYEGIGLSCRRDYGLDNFWYKLGFSPIWEKPGRGKKGKILTFWWYDHGHPKLFTIAEENKIRSNLFVVLDSSTFFDLKSPDSPETIESKALLADWLKEEIDLCLTEEIFNKINRQEDEKERQKCRNFAHSFLKVQIKHEEVDKVSKQLRLFFKPPLSERDKSDIKHLAHSIVGHAQFFITKDEELMKKSDAIFKNFGMKIINPSNLIIRLDELRRSTDYQTDRLAGTVSSIRLVKSEDIENLINSFFSKKQKEKKAQFKRSLSNFLSKPYIYESKIVIDKNNQHIALITLGRKIEKVLEIPLLRIRHPNLSKTLSEHLILTSILISSQEKRIFTSITDQYLSNNIIESLFNNYFVSTNNFWLKINIPGVQKLDNLINILNSFIRDYPQFNKFLADLINRIKKASINLDPWELLKLERSLWPLKIVETDIPCYIVPIKPRWAMHLFDKYLAEQDLFGAEFELAINRENIYYRSKRPKVLSAPARILWYVSHDKNIPGSKQLRACSYLDEVIIERPKDLYKLFKHLGVYRWKDVYSLAHKNINNKIMAFKFSNTELFSHPISWNDLKDILFKEEKRRALMQSPIRISNSCFYRIYSIATK